MLLERGAMINARCDSDRTALHFAADQGRTDFVRLFLEHGADVNARGINGETPSEVGSELGHHEIVKLLSDHRLKYVKK